MTGESGVTLEEFEALLDELVHAVRNDERHGADQYTRRDVKEAREALISAWNARA